MSLTVKGLTVGLLQENCYILGCDQTQKGAIIDPGDNARDILRTIDAMGIFVEKIINTHAHFDHVLAVNAVKQATGATFHLHKDDLPMLEMVPQAAARWLDSHADPVDAPDEFLEHGQQIQVGESTLEVRFTPGHAPGHVIFIDHDGKQVFGGDTLFQGSIGRFDLPGSDGPTLLRSIREQIFSLPDEYIVYPGHGGPTQVGIEKVHNPFVGGDTTEE